MPRDGEVGYDAALGALQRGVQMRLGGQCLLQRRPPGDERATGARVLGGLTVFAVRLAVRRQPVRAVGQRALRGAVGVQRKGAIGRARQEDAGELDGRERLEVEVVAVSGVPNDGVIYDALQRDFAIVGRLGGHWRGTCYEEGHSQQESSKSSKRCSHKPVLIHG